MIHYTCDMCGRPMGPDQLRYSVEIHVHPVQEPPAGGLDADFDALETLHEMLEDTSLDPEDGEAEGEMLEGELHAIQLDLCPCCRKRFVKNPLNRESVSHQTGFSDN